MLDIKFIRENPDAVRENIKKKFQDAKLPLVDEVLDLDSKRRAAIAEADQLRSNRNTLSKQIGMLMGQAKKDPSKLEEAEAVKAQVKANADRLAELESKDTELAQQIRHIMLQIPNIIDPSVPIGPDDSYNVEVQRFGEPVVPDFEIPYHTQIMESFNGIDMDAFNPETDPKIFKNYGPNNPQDKLVNKTELLKLCGLEGDANTPVIGIVTRFVDQKGLDLVEAVLPDILADDVRLIVLGTGDYRYEQMFIEAKRRWPDKVSASIMFSGDLANRIYAGADMFLMPSKFEPCGLAQMIALRYGTIPIVRETGGLKDTVHAFVDYAGTGNGFTFASYNAHDMLHVIREACGVFRFNKPAWSKLIMQGMQSDFSWGSSADKYIEVYKTAMGQ